MFSDKTLIEIPEPRGEVPSIHQKIDDGGGAKKRSPPGSPKTWLVFSAFKARATAYQTFIRKAPSLFPVQIILT
jgi:hypothetical protein